ncbi:MAG: alpha/beta fold hydrolase [Myxococcales bacterium]|nr:alpha/beta fold hydrolase [Myxococcales bacterium]
MILNSSLVEQTIDGDQLGTFVKEIVLARPLAASEPPRLTGVDTGHAPRTLRPSAYPHALAITHPGDVPLALVRKRAVLTSAAGGGTPGAGPTSGRGRTAPTKAPVLLVHGYGQNRYAWHLPSRSFSNYLAAGGYDVFNLDLRGHGRSRYLGARPPKDLSEYVREDLPAAVAEVRRLSGERPVFLVGHSLGGLISYAAAARLKDAVAGVVTLGSPYHFTAGSRFLSLLGSAMLAVDRAVPLGHGALPLKGAGELLRLARVLMESPIFPLPIRGYAPGSIERRVLGQHMSLAMDQGSITVIRNMFLRAAEARATGHRLGVLYGYAAAFEALDLPLLVIAGSEDSLAPPESVEPAFARSHSSDKTYRVFPRGHIDIIMGRDAPLTVWPLILAWLHTHVRQREGGPQRSGGPRTAA